MLVLVLCSSTYVLASDVFRFDGSNQNTITNSVTYLPYSVVNFAQNLTIRSNTTDTKDRIVFVNFTLVDPDGVVAINNVNGTQFGDFWNSTHYIINKSGTWSYYILSGDNETSNTTLNNYSNSFTITDSLYKDLIQITEVVPIWHNLTYTIEIYSTSRETLNFTLGKEMDNNLTLKFNQTYIQLNSTRYKSYFQVNISSNSSSLYGIHYGNITITRNEPFYRVFTIPISIEISDNYGDIEHQNATDYTLTSCGGTLVHSTKVVNNGNYPMTDCRPYLYNEDGVEVSTPTIFSIGAGSTATAYVSYVYGGGSTITTHFGVRCTASPSGGYDYTSSNPEITFSPGVGCGGTGGGGGSIQIVEKPYTEIQTPTLEDIPGLCGNGVCEEGETPWDCPDDCLKKVFEFDDIFCTPIFKCGNWDKAWFINGIIILVTILMGILFYRASQTRRKI